MIKEDQSPTMRTRLWVPVLLMWLVQDSSASYAVPDSSNKETDPESSILKLQSHQPPCASPYSNPMLLGGYRPGQKGSSCAGAAGERSRGWTGRAHRSSNLHKSNRWPNPTSSFLMNSETIRDTFNNLFKFYLPVPASLDGFKIKELMSHPGELASLGDDFLHENEADQTWMPSGTKIQKTERSSAHYSRPLSRAEGAADANDIEGMIQRLPEPYITAQCAADVITMYKVFNLEEESKSDEQYKLYDNVWHYKMMDSWGKSEDGYLLGNNKYLGFFKECMDTNSGAQWPEQRISGQYCYVTVVEASDNETLFTLPTSYGTCIPSSCTQEDLHSSLKYHMADIGYFPSNVECIKKDEHLEYGPWEIVGCIIIGSLLLLVLVSAAVDLTMKENCPAFFKAFSAAENMSKILAVKLDAPGEISCIYGIRVLSICWVMLGHQYAFIIGSGSNYAGVLEITKVWMFQVIWSGYKSVDTFFTIGGLLVAKSLLKESFCIEKPRKTESRLKPVQKQSKTTESALNLVETSHGNEVSLDTLNANEAQLAEENAKAPPNNKDLENTQSHFDTIEQKGHTTEPIPHVRESSFYDVHLWMRLKQQGWVTTLKIFFWKYFLYLTNRIIRMWPTMFIVMLFCAGPSSFFIWGPRREYYKSYLATCRTNWWTDLTFFTNFILKSYSAQSISDPEFDKPTDSCISHNWYIAVDFQVQLVLPFLILPCKMIKHKTVYLSLLLLVACIIPGLIVVVADILPAFIMNANSYEGYRFFEEFYVMPYARASPYFVGALFALLLVEAEEGKRTGVVPRWQVILSKKPTMIVGWAIFFITCQAVVFGLAGANSYSFAIRPENRPRDLGGFEEFMYGSFAIAAWAACIGWMVVMCALKLAGPINLFLSHPMWQPLSRVSYPVYLISLPIQRLIFANIYRTVYLTNLSIIMSYCGVVVFSFLSSFAISLIAESPFIALNRMLRGRA